MNLKIQKIIRLGIIGSGTRMRAVLKELKKADFENQIQISTAYDPYSPALDCLAAEFGTSFERVSSEQMVAEHPDVDWVLIGSWNCFHARQAVLALNAGKHVFCEKPLATTLQDCLAIQKAARRSGRIFSLGLVLRYSVHYAKIEEILQSGLLGRILSFEFNETLGFNHGGYIFGNWRRLTRNAGSHILEKCCHDLDLANWLLRSVPVKVASFGGRDYFRPENSSRAAEIGADPRGRLAYQTFEDPERVTPFGNDADIFDNQVAIMSYANGIRATFHTNCHSAIPERRMMFVGTHGALRADLLTGKVELREIGWSDERVELDTSTRDGHGGGDAIMAESLRRTMLYGEKPLASITEGICSAITAFALDRAAETNRVVDLLPLWREACVNPTTVMEEISRDFTKTWNQTENAGADIPDLFPSQSL